MNKTGRTGYDYLTFAFNPSCYRVIYRPEVDSVAVEIAVVSDCFCCRFIFPYHDDWLTWK